VINVAIYEVSKLYELGVSKENAINSNT